jgi:AcrR family transcriptional regulator
MQSVGEAADALGGIDLVIEQAGVAKASLYRHFRTKDDLVAAFLEREDHDFWSVWDAVAAQHTDDPRAELDAHLEWIGARIARPNYRGCPQLNVAAEFADSDHPARLVAAAHKRELRRRIHAIVERLHVARPDDLAGALTVLVNGAFVSSSVLDPDEATPLLQSSSRALLAAHDRVAT